MFRVKHSNMYFKFDFPPCCTIFVYYNTRGMSIPMARALLVPIKFGHPEQFEGTHRARRTSVAFYQWHNMANAIEPFSTVFQFIPRRHSRSVGSSILTTLFYPYINFIRVDLLNRVVARIVRHSKFSLIRENLQIYSTTFVGRTRELNSGFRRL